MIRLLATYQGPKRKGFDINQGYIIYPARDWKNEIYIHNKYGNHVTYKNLKEFKNCWNNLSPYRGCIKAEKFIQDGSV